MLVTSNINKTLTDKLSLFRAIIFLIPHLWFLGNLNSQNNESLVQALADSAQQFNDHRSLPYLDRAFNICNDFKCEDSTLARLYQRKSVAYYLAVIDFDKSLAYTDSAIMYYENAYGSDHLITANSYFNRGAIQSSLGKLAPAKSSIEIALEKLMLNNTISSAVQDSIKLH